MLLVLMLIHCAVVNTQNASVSSMRTEIQKVAVMDFEFDRLEKEEIILGHLRRPKNAGSIMADIFTEKLLDTGLYHLIERRQIKKILDEYGLSMSGLFESSSLKEIGKILNVDGLIVGIVSEFQDYQAGLGWGGEVDFSARLIELKSGLVVWSVSARRNIGNSNSGIAAHSAADVAIQELLKKIK